MEATNQFVLVSNNATAEGLNHGYDHTTVNPYTGDIYHRDYDSTTIERKVYGGSSFAALSSSWNSRGFTQADIASCWWSGPFSGGSGAGTQGCLLICNPYYNSGGSLGQISAYNPLSGSWFFESLGVTPGIDTSGGPRGNVIEYSDTKNVAVYGGGVGAETRLWRLDPTGACFAMPNVPSGKQLGIQGGNLVCDPKTGNFLLLSAGQLWELNPTGSGAWAQQTGSRVPPAGVGVPGPTNPQAVISCALPEHGVVAYIRSSCTSTPSEPARGARRSHTSTSSARG